MKITPLFPTPLISHDLPEGGAIAAVLRQLILRREAENGGVARSNDGGWQSDDDFESWGGPAGARVLAECRAVVDRYTATFDGAALARAALPWRQQCWANINRSGAANVAHFHPGAYWSACFYVDDGGIAGGEAFGGALEFFDPRGVAPLMYAPTVKMAVGGCVSAGLGERVFPRTGELLVFPAWLAHAVTRYTGGGTRISLTINYCL